MSPSFVSTLSLLLSAAGAANAAKQCPIQFEGRVPTNFTPTDFDTSASPFNNGFVFGKGLKASDVVTIPTGLNSLVGRCLSLTIDEPRC